MDSVAAGFLVFACVFAAAMLGMALRLVLPEHHFSSDTKDTVKLAMGFVATMSALILGLLVASAKEAYDTEKTGVTQMAVKSVFLDRLLALYGPETKPTRELLRRAVERVEAAMWPQSASAHAELDPSRASAEAIYLAVQELHPQSDLQTALKSQALSVTLELGQMRWSEFEQSAAAISTPLLVILVFWISVLFVSFGLFSPSNGTVVVALMLAAFSVSGAIYLILELDHPFDGLIQISDAPFVNAIAHLGQ